MPHTSPSRRALLVDDDPVSLLVLSQMISKQDWEVAKASSAKAALEILQRESRGKYDAVLTDYHMPEMNGLELVAAVRDVDSSLATILITSDSERSTLSDSLKEGVLDFLEKPVKVELLAAALSKGVVHTREHRRLQEDQARLRKVADIQRRLAPELHLCSQSGLSCLLRTRCYPLYEAGGDFLSVCSTAEGSVQVAMGDISGHGLQEGFIATYFQGMVKGMQSLGAPAQQIVRQCNDFLLQEWVNSSDLPCSLSALFLELDLAAKVLTLTNCGCPEAFLYKHGELPLAITVAGSPLGWFAEPQPGAISFTDLDTGHIVFWSDGLVDYAERLGVLPEAMATRLLLSEAHGTPAILKNLAMPDDILVAKLAWTSSRQSEEADFFSVFHTTISGDLGNGIDELQSNLVANLRIALPNLPEVRIDNIDLCAREAVLNAVQHGCKLDPNRFAHLAVEYHTAERPFLRVIVEDDGEGYGLETTNFSKDILDDPREHVSIGLSVMQNLADAIRREKRGAHIEMDFFLEPS